MFVPWHWFLFDVCILFLDVSKYRRASVFCVVGEEGLEPSWPCDRWLLKPVRLPVPPLALKSINNEQLIINNYGAYYCLNISFCQLFIVNF